MELALAFAVGVSLAMDAFAVAIGASLTIPRVGPGHVFRFAFHFGLFQSAMLLLGWHGGRTVADLISSWDHWVAFAMLAVVGGRSIRSALVPEPIATDGFDPTRGWPLAFLSVATSIDALAVGVGLAAVSAHIVLTAVVVGLTAAAFTVVGMMAGRRLGLRFGRRMELVGGIVLLLIAIQILASHLA